MDIRPVCVRAVANLKMFKYWLCNMLPLDTNVATNNGYSFFKCVTLNSVRNEETVVHSRDLVRSDTCDQRRN